MNLTELQLDDTQILDISPLTPMTKLEKLSLKNTPVSDLGPLKASKKLKSLNIGGTPLTDVSALGPLVATINHRPPSGRVNVLGKKYSRSPCRWLAPNAVVWDAHVNVRPGLLMLLAET